MTVFSCARKLVIKTKMFIKTINATYSYIFLTKSKLTFVKGGNSQRGFHFFHTQNRPGPLSVQEIPTLLAAKAKQRLTQIFNISIS